MTGWKEALDAFEEQLSIYRSVLELGDEPEVLMWPPDDLAAERIPDELVPRARELLALAQELEAELAAAAAAAQLPLNNAWSRRSVPGRPTISAQL